MQGCRRCSARVPVRASGERAIHGRLPVMLRPSARAGLGGGGNPWKAAGGSSSWHREGRGGRAVHGKQLEILPPSARVGLGGRGNPRKAAESGLQEVLRPSAREGLG